MASEYLLYTNLKSCYCLHPPNPITWSFIVGITGWSSFNEQYFILHSPHLVSASIDTSCWSIMALALILIHFFSHIVYLETFPSWNCSSIIENVSIYSFICTWICFLPLDSIKRILSLEWVLQQITKSSREFELGARWKWFSHCMCTCAFSFQ